MSDLQLAALVSEIGTVAPKVAKELSEQKAAFEAELEAETKLLTSVIEIAKPALPAVCGNVGLGVPGLLLWEGKTKFDFPLKLYVLVDGCLLEEWEHRDSDTGEVLTRQRPREPHLVCEKYPVADLITAFHGAILKQNGRRARSTAVSREEVSKLRAILTLLDAEPPVGNEPVESAGEDIPF